MGRLKKLTEEEKRERREKGQLTDTSIRRARRFIQSPDEFFDNYRVREPTQQESEEQERRARRNS